MLLLLDYMGDEIAMNRKQPNHWGKWLRSRWRFVGHLRLSDLAKAVGCSNAIVFQWIKFSSPPERMQKGFDGRLAAALRTDRFTLFSAYALTAVEKAPLIDDSANDGDKRAA
jgi:hypothetical protein